MVGILPQDRSDPGRKDFCARAAAAERGERSVKSFPLRRWARSLPSGSAVQGGDEGRGEKELNAANVYGGFPVCQVCASQPHPVCGKDCSLSLP